nr:hypothetical protein [Tanacetum cinerariifolium]
MFICGGLVIEFGEWYFIITGGRSVKLNAYTKRISVASILAHARVFSGQNLRADFADTGRMPESENRSPQQPSPAAHRIEAYLKLDIVMFLESNLECAGGGKETKTVDWRMKSSVCIWVFGRTLRRRFLWTPMSMALKQVMAEEDSEDEVDDDVANLEDQRMLDDFLDVTQDEKHMMQLWNSFIRKQRYFNSAYVL